MTGWLPSWEDTKDKFTDMTAEGGEVDSIATTVNDWITSLWDKMTGWIPSIDDIKGAAGDFGAWIKQIATDIKLWFWDSSKPQIIGIDLSKFSESIPSGEDIKAAIMGLLPDWLQPDSVEEKRQKEVLEKSKEVGFFDKDYAGKSEIDDKMIAGMDTETLQAVLALEGDDLHKKDKKLIIKELEAREAEVPVYHTGGPVKTSGLYNLSAGEIVMDNNASQLMMKAAELVTVKSQLAYEEASGGMGAMTVIDTSQKPTNISADKHFYQSMKVDHTDETARQLNEMTG
jgi:hypothetical protein